MLENRVERLGRLRNGAQIARDNHEYAAMRHARHHFQLGIAATILTAVVGTAVFASMAKDSIALWAKIVVALISLLAAVATALQAFLGLEKRAESHRSTRAEYDAIARKIDLFLADYDSSDCTVSPEQAWSFIEKIDDRIDKTFKGAPLLEPEDREPRPRFVTWKGSPGELPPEATPPHP